MSDTSLAGPTPTGWHLPSPTVLRWVAGGRAGGPIQRTLTELKSLFFGFTLGSPILRFDLDRELAVLNVVAEQVNRPPTDAQLNVQPRSDGGYGLAITPEVPGTRLVLDDS